MRLVLRCDCGEEERFDLLACRSGDHLRGAIDEWKNEHLRWHEKVGDDEPHVFESEVEP